MKVVFEKFVLLEALSVANGCVSTKNAQNVTEGFLIETNEAENCCVISAYDTEKGIRFSVPCKIFEGGSYVIEAEKLLPRVKNLGNEVTLSVDAKGMATVSSGTTVYQLHTLPGEQFPNLPELNVDGGFSIKQSELAEMIAATKFAMGVNDTRRPQLNGSYFVFNNGELTIVTCDSNRLAIKTKKCEITGISDEECKFILPAKSVEELIKLLGNEEIITIKPLKRQIIFKIGEKIFFSKLIAEEYIDYKRFIPQTSSIFVNVNRDVLLSHLTSARVSTDDKDAGKTKPPIKCNFEGDTLYLSCKTITGTFNSELPIEHEGENLKIGFNCGFLFDAVSACDCDKIKLALTSAHMSMIVTAAEEKEGSSFIYLVLPTKFID